MKIIVDENVSFAKEAFLQFGDVILTEGRKIDNQIIKEADILIIRSVTTVNKELLKDTKIKFIGTATIGTDHVNSNAIEENKIRFVNAKGCNSYAVAEYVITAILSISNKHGISLENKSIGIIGYGNVGKKVEKLLKAIGLNTIVNDPPLQDAGFNYNFATLNETLQCDIVTFHVPLNIEGKYKSLHLLNANNISLIKKDAIIINTSRGAVIDNKVLLNKINNDGNLTILDVWENEPKCLPELINKVELGTAHIAGYTYEGKVIGTKMIYDQLCNFLNEKPIWEPPIYGKILKQYFYNNQLNFFTNLQLISKDIYDIYTDSINFKSDMIKYNSETIFDNIRKNYKLRYEFPNFSITNINANTIKIITKVLRFK